MTGSVSYSLIQPTTNAKGSLNRRENSFSNDWFIAKPDWAVDPDQLIGVCWEGRT